ncbi:MAG: histidine kinase N-terminal 7TM domain-containing protein, partial [Acidobacteriota bacterium]|nr:histidine kinase N-terminal 7TM domain-containing protein [Acidobacteriota bacterium]
MYSASSLFFFTALALTFILAGLLAGYLRRRRDLPGARAFFWLAVAQSLLAFAEILSLFAGSAGKALFWFKIRFVFSALMPVFWIWFALDYSGRKKWIGRRLAAGLFLIPLITQVMVWTNDRHHLFVKREVGFVLKGPFWIADTGVRTAGVWFLVHSFYGLILLFAGMA